MDYNSLAIEQVHLAEKKANPNFWTKLFGPDPDQYVISDHYEKAANYFMLAKDYPSAAHCYVLAASQKSHCYMKAVKAYITMDDVDSAIGTLKTALKFHKSNGNIDRMAKLYIKLAELSDDINIELKYYRKAFDVEETISTARILAEKSTIVANFDDILKYYTFLYDNSKVLYRKHWILANWLAGNISLAKKELAQQPDPFIDEIIAGGMPRFSDSGLKMLATLFSEQAIESSESSEIDYT